MFVLMQSQNQVIEMIEEILLSKEVSKIILNLVEVSYDEGLLPPSKELTKLMNYIHLKYPQLFEKGSYTLHIYDRIKEDFISD